MTYLTDISDQHAEAADDALHELYDGRDEWAEGDRPTTAEIEREEFERLDERWREWWS